MTPGAHCPNSPHNEKSVAKYIVMLFHAARLRAETIHGNNQKSGGSRQTKPLLVVRVFGLKMVTVVNAVATCIDNCTETCVGDWLRVSAMVALSSEPVSPVDL